MMPKRRTAIADPAHTRIARIIGLSYQVAEGKGSRAELRQALVEAPDVAAKTTLQTLAVSRALEAYDQPMMEESCRLRMEQIKAGLGYDTAPELERLLIDEIALCWLRVGEAEAMYSQIMGDTHQPGRALYAERRLSACLARQVRACEALARVRRLSKGTAAVQVNIAGQQIVTG